MKNDKSGKTKGSEHVIIGGEDFTDTDPMARIVQASIGSEVISRYQINLVLKALRKVGDTDMFATTEDDVIKLHERVTVTLSAETSAMVLEEIERQRRECDWRDPQTPQALVEGYTREFCDAMSYDYIRMKRA